MNEPELDYMALMQERAEAEAALNLRVITCTHCGKAVTPGFLWDENSGPFILRGFAECYECVEASTDEAKARITALEAERDKYHDLAYAAASRAEVWEHKWRLVIESIESAILSEREACAHLARQVRANSTNQSVIQTSTDIEALILARSNDTSYVSHRLPPETAGASSPHCSKCGETVPVTSSTTRHAHIITDTTDPSKGPPLPQ